MSSADKLRRLAGHLPARCFWLDLPTAMAAEIAGRAGVELAVIDSEHGQLGPETVTGMIRALDLGGTPALVRLGDAGAGRVKHALDAGAAGVIVPYVESVAEAEAAVRAFYTPPLGTRGLASVITRCSGYGSDGSYGREWNDRGLLVLQIETRKGLAAAPAIAALEGVDMLFFGPSDFALDAGLDPAADAGRLFEVFAEMTAAAHGAGKLAGAFPWPGGEPRRLLEAGADLVAVASDVRLLLAGFKDALAATPLKG